ncbi:hypothetical protein FM076_16005 [Streptomyces albus subsp. chlorinus]|uniref:hypothetical protein n=1 Tax=Streptomyces albus TaxID=1888 RepID=UPI00156D4C29|nr:hypothetical protein [Streptomyces albus]NSC22592.1 hypothetical protein [Streptomyces albus subsp. chlorinus]
MARIRTARVLAAAAVLPVAAAVLSGVAQADNGSLADDEANSTASDGSRVQGAVGGGTNTTNADNTTNANNATVNGNGAVVDQSNETHNESHVIVFRNLW